MDQTSESVVTSASSCENLQHAVNDDNALSLPSVKEVYGCPYTSCNFTTAWKSSLNMHMKTHTDERPWQCALCNKHFKLKHHLKHHILTHSQNKLFKCNLCEYRCNDSHSLQRHKVNRHRFPMKRSTKQNSLPTMVPMPSVESFSTSSNTFFNSLLDQQSLTTGTDESSALQMLPEASTSAASGKHTSGSLSSISQMLMQHQQKNLQSASNLKLRNIRSVSDSFSPSFCQRILSTDNDPIIDLSDDIDKANNIQRSVSPTESIPMTVKEEVCNDRDSPGSASLQKTPNSHTSFDYLHGNRSSVDLISKSPLGKRFSVSSREQNHSPVFEERPKTPELLSGSVGNTATQVLPLNSNKAASPWKCAHCDIIFPDNIMYGLHRGCHSVGSPFQCNICGMKCKDSHDFMFHFTIGKHLP